MQISLTLDGRQIAAEAPLGATLRQFLEGAGACLPVECSVLSDGKRALLLDLELAYRHSGALLSSDVPSAFLAQTEALLPNDLLVLTGSETL